MSDDLKAKIYENLIAIDPNSFYGLASETFLRTTQELNYIVFGSGGFSKAGTSGTDLVDYFTVAIIRESFVSDTTKQKVIKAMLSIPGVRLADKDAQSSFMKKGTTDTLIELLVITFAKARKGYVDASN